MTSLGGHNTLGIWRTIHGRTYTEVSVAHNYQLASLAYDQRVLPSQRQVLSLKYVGRHSQVCFCASHSLPLTTNPHSGHRPMSDQIMKSSMRVKALHGGLIVSWPQGPSVASMVEDM